MHIGGYSSTGGAGTARDGGEDYRSLDSLPHDTRRGASRYRAEDGWREADAIEDPYARMRALDALRAKVRRERRVEQRVPDSHTIAAVLADTLGLVLPALDEAAVCRVRHALRRALAHRQFDPNSPAVKRALDLRLRPHERILESEEQDRGAAQVTARMKAATARRDEATRVSDAEFRRMFENEREREDA